MKFKILKKYRSIKETETHKCTFEPAHEIMALFVLHKLILQTRMRSHPVGLDVWFLVGPFVWAFAGRLCDKYHNLISWLICCEI